MEVTRLKIERGWPFGISDGLVLPCARCGGEVKFDYGVDDESWNEVVPQAWKTGVVCLPCFDKMANEKNVDYCVKDVQFTGENRTVILEPIKEYVYE